MRSGRRLRRLTPAVVIGVLVVGVSRIVSLGGGEYVAGPIAGLLVHMIPTPVLTWTIATFGAYAGVLFALTAGGLTALLFAVVIYVGTRSLSRFGLHPSAISLILALLLSLIAMGLTGNIWHAIGLGLIGGTVLWLTERLAQSRVPDGQWSRRETVRAAVGGLLFGIGALFIGRRPKQTEPEPSLPERTRREIETLQTAAATNEFDDIPGLSGLLTPIGEFYVVDIALDPPVIDADSWSVTIGGAVDTEVTITRDRLDLFDPVSELLTLRCIGESLNGTLMGSAVWTGVPVATLLDRAEPNGSYVKLSGADGYWEVVPIDMLEEALFVYAMNGRQLPREHGFPARILIPGSWGKVNVKWVTGIEVLTENEDGFWSEWEGTSSVNTVAKLWYARPTADGFEVAGHAYAGSRGISAVEVSVDGGDSWEEAILSGALPHSATWRQWRYEWQPDEERVDVTVRAIDGDGQLQTETFSEPKPNGATGWVSRRVSTTEVTDFARLS